MYMNIEQATQAVKYINVNLIFKNASYGEAFWRKNWYRMIFNEN